jgi:hypothetical protein
MTKNDIIRMAREAGLQPYYDEQESDITAFANLVAKHEREACAKLVVGLFNPEDVVAEAIAEAILARGNT